jgi:hypothetical protein
MDSRCLFLALCFESDADRRRYRKRRKFFSIANTRII